MGLFGTLTLYQMAKFKLVQIESVCRRQSNVTENLKFDFGRVETIGGKGENAGNQRFLLFPQ